LIADVDAGGLNRINRSILFQMQRDAEVRSKQRPGRDGVLRRRTMLSRAVRLLPEWRRISGTLF